MFSSNTTQVSNAANYIEDVFSTYLYTGNGSTQTITNGIDLAGKGGLVWFKNRGAVANHLLLDSARGSNALSSNTTGAEAAGYPLSMLSTGFTINDNDTTWNASSNTYASWTFRKQPKFFDVVTGTGSGTFNHNLQSVPGCIILKRTDGASSWFVKHNGLTGGITGTYDVTLNTTAAQSDSGVSFNPTSTQFTVAGYISAGETWVAYLFAHDAGGFGLTGTDNVISCGSYSGSTNAQEITLGYEPQWLLVKCTSASVNSDWLVVDVMRGMTVGAVVGTYIAPWLLPNSSAAESPTESLAGPTPTGFILRGNEQRFNYNGRTYIYIAIRRGPMKVPTSGTSVFAPQTTVNGAFPYFTSGFPVDLGFRRANRASTGIYIVGSRLTGDNYLDTTSTAAETSGGGIVKFDSNTGWYNFTSTAPAISWMFQRAPSFFDEVCYTGTGSARTISHNLGVAPELMIVKRRNTSGSSWIVYSSGIAVSNILLLNNTTASGTNTGAFNSTAPTSSVFTVGTSPTTNESASTFVAYLFATCAGVSKVGSYTGTGATQTISCGFTGGARFVLIKRTDSTGDWYVWDTARGMVAGTDPSLLLNSTAAEINANSIYTTTGGFQIVSTAAGINASGGTYIYLAIA